jgi:two-component system chemotaxis sensor kinase CheA
VVNDDVGLANSVQRFLAGHGFETRIAHDGADALQTLVTWPADLVLLDLIMPRLDGWGFLQQRAASPALQRAVVLVWSAAASDDMQRAYTLGATQCLSRSRSTPHDLLAAINTLVAATD